MHWPNLLRTTFHQRRNLKRVIKLGGSLFDFSGIGTALQAWVADNQNLQNIVICGGGNFVNCIRSWDEIHELSEEAAHWISVQALSITSQLLAQLLPDAEVTDDPQTATNTDRPVIIFEPTGWLRSRFELPKSWDFTSDSIAAAFAVTINSPELVLMKSTMPAGTMDPTVLGETGFVDLHFEQFARLLRHIRLVNLRNRMEKEVFWPPIGGPAR